MTYLENDHNHSRQLDSADEEEPVEERDVAARIENQIGSRHRRDGTGCADQGIGVQHGIAAAGRHAIVRPWATPGRQPSWLAVSREKFVRPRVQTAQESR